MTEPANQFDSEIEEPDVSHLITEDDEPVDNPFSEKQQRLLTDALYTSWSEEMRCGRPFVAFANVGLFFVPKNPALVPDVQVSLDCELPDDLWEKKNRSYMTWVYGKPPDVIVEIVSNTKGGETERKFKTYSEQGVGYYIIYDPQCLYGKRRLRAYVLHGREYIDLVEPSWMPGTLLGLQLWEGVYEDYEATWIRWCDQDGNLLATGLERALEANRVAERAEREVEAARLRAEMASEQVEAARGEAEAAKGEAEAARGEAEAAKGEAEAAKGEAEAAKARAEAEKSRAESLAARLRELGVEP